MRNALHTLVGQAVPAGADATPYGVLLVALALVGTVVATAMKLTSGSQTRGDNAFAAHLQTLVQDRDRAVESVKRSEERAERAEARAETAEREAHRCRTTQETQAQEMFDLRLRVATLETAMRTAGLTPP